MDSRYKDIVKLKSEEHEKKSEEKNNFAKSLQNFGYLPDSLKYKKIYKRIIDNCKKKSNNNTPEDINKSILLSLRNSKEVEEDKDEKQYVNNFYKKRTRNYDMMQSIIIEDINSTEDINSLKDIIDLIKIESYVFLYN